MTDRQVSICCVEMAGAVEERGIQVDYLSKEENYNVCAPGCCGTGGCNVLNYMKFCPFCGIGIETVEMVKNDKESDA